MNKSYKNIGIFAHVDAGKTSLTEQLLFKSGATNHLGSVDQGNTHTDTMALERERGISIMSTPTSYYYKNEKVNIIDTPGHVDFIAEVERSMLVLDAAILVISAREGVQSHTKLLASTLHRLRIPTLIFINKIDRIGVNINRVLSDIKNHLFSEPIILQQVKHTGDKTACVSNIYETDKEILINVLSEMDDKLLESYLTNKEIPMSEIIHSTALYTKSCQLYPVLFGSAKHGTGIDSCLKAIYDLLPRFEGSDTDPVGGVVFKIARDHAKIKEVYVKLTSGRVLLRQYIDGEKITSIKGFSNGKIENQHSLETGDIGILHGLNQIGVGQTFGNCTLKPLVPLVNPTLKSQIKPLRPSLRSRLLDALTLLSEADPYMNYQFCEKTGEIEITFFGYVQMEIIKELLRQRFDLDIIFDDPSMIYMETICSAGQSLVQIQEEGYPFNAAVGFYVEPLPRGSGILYESNINTGMHSKATLKAVKDGVFSCLDQGLKGWQMTDMRIVFDYFDQVKLHIIPSTTPKDHRDLAPLVLFNVIREAGTKLLWPINNYRLTIPSIHIGRAISDIGAMSGTVSEPSFEGDFCSIEGHVPLAYSSKYHIDVHKYSSGMGYFETWFKGYEEAPQDIDVRRKKFKVDPSNRGEYLLHLMGGM